MKKIEDKYKVLDQISHILLRPGTYVGSNKPGIFSKYVVDGNKFIKKDITIIPSFIKIFDEIITNSVDESKRNKKLNKIDVVIDIEKNIISVSDNGGIPIEIHKDYNQYVPEVIFGNLMSGSNYDDNDERTVAGLNGLGSKLTNVFSKEFIVSSCDGKKQFIQTFKNNMKERSEAVIKKSKYKHTKITYKPDLSQFNLDKIDNDHFKIIEKRIYDLAGTNNDIEFTFNGRIIRFKSFEDYIKLYNKTYFFDAKKDKSWSLGVGHSEEGFQQVSFVNSTDTYDGGSHVDYILNQIVNKMRDFFKKKHKYDIKPSDIKSHLFIFINSTVINPAFSSQTKEKLITEIKEFGYEFDVSDKLVNQILKSEVVDSILDWIEKKKEADENKLARQLNKKASKIKVDKLIDAKGKERWKCSLGIFEGDSATSAFRKYRIPETMGAFALKGKFTNVNGVSNSKLFQNAEVVNLMGSIGLKIGHPINLKDLRYGRILLYVDADVDGNHIASLLLNFFHTYWPEMFDRNMVYKVETPIVVAIEKRNKNNKKLFYSQKEYDNWLNRVNVINWEIKYKKGLASLIDEEYKEIINNPKLTNINKDDLSEKSLEIWFGKDSDLRKKEMLE